jgi:hypothetical protein
MSSRSITKYLNPWKFRRDQHAEHAEHAEHVKALRSRDGDNCARCRRPLRFDLPAGHDQGAAIELVVPALAGGLEEIGNLKLCHARCNSSGMDHTDEVTARIRRKNEATLLSKSRRRQTRAA